MTYWPNNLHADWLKPDVFKFPPNSVRNWCASFQYCPTTGKLHAHAYVEFRNGIKFSTLRNKIETHTGSPGDIKKPDLCSDNQRQCAVNYVLNAETRAPDTESFIWSLNKDTLRYDPNCKPNENATKRQKRVDKSNERKRELIEYIDSKPVYWSWGEIVTENMASKLLLVTCGWGQTYHNARLENAPRQIITNVIIMFGAGGTGKTTMAEAWFADDMPDERERYYKRNYQDGVFWGGGSTKYKNERIIHLEEFSGQEKFSQWKMLCDLGKHGPKINVKGAGAKLNHDTVIMTSNIHPAGWYHKLWREDEKQFQQFSRRVTQVLFFPPFKPDGSVNVPDKDGPHFTDITEEFQSWNHNYDDAKVHAAVVWPLPERELTASLGFNPHP